MKTLRLAVGARDLARDYRGIGRYSRSVVSRLAGRGDVDLTLLVDGPFGFRRRAELERAIGSSRFHLATRVPHDADVVWHPANGTFFHSDKASVVTIHDVAPFRFPNPDPRKRQHEQAPFVHSACTLRHAIAVSRFGRDEMHAMLDVPLERTTVIYHGVEPALSPAPQRMRRHPLVDRDYLLFVGDASEPRKNFSFLYGAYRQAWPGGDGPRLVVVGPPPPELPGVAGMNSLSDEQMVGLYREATALVLPASYEAFGMPMIEAMACGAPVLASSGSCLPEIGGTAPLYADPNDAPAWAAALRVVADDAAVRERLRTAGLERAALFDWDRSTERHLEVFRATASLVAV